MKKKAVSFLIITALLLPSPGALAQTLVVRIPIISESFDGDTVGNTPNAAWQIPAGVLYGISVAEAPANPQGKALKFIRTPEMSNEGSNQEMSITLTNTLRGTVSFSWDSYFPNNVTAENGTVYNRQSEAQNQGGLRLLSEDGTEVFYVPFITYLPRAILRYGVAGSSSTLMRNYNLIYNQWYSFRAVLRLGDREMDFYVNNVLDGTYPMQNVSKPSSDVKRIGLYLHRDAKTTLMYIDNLAISDHTTVSFEPEELVLDYTVPPMDYSTKIIRAAGSIAPFLGGKAYCKLVNADSGETVVQLEQDTTYQDGKGTFSFAYEVAPDVSGWHNVIVGGDYIVSDEGGRTTRLYIASDHELENLASDFSGLPADPAAAKAVIRGYIPLLASGAEAALFTDSESSADYITSYFQRAGKAYTQISEVQSEYLRACSYLAFNTAEGDALGAALAGFAEAAGYLADSAYVSHKAEFLSHFARRRADTEIYGTQDLEAALRYCLAMTKLNHAKKSSLAGIVAAYNDIFGLDISSPGILALNQDELYSALYNNAYIDVEQLRGDYQDKAEALANAPKSTGAPGGNGGGGGAAAKTLYSLPPEELTPPLVAPVEAPSPTDDVSGHWARASIQKLMDAHAVTGYPDGTFRPNNTITRAEFLTMLVRVMRYGEGGAEIPFGDVSEGDWYYQAVSAAAQNAIITGDNGFFLPNAEITREQLAVMVYRAKQGTLSDAGESGFTDGGEISDYARDAVSRLHRAGMLSGYEDGSFRPQNATTRAEAARLLAGLME